VSLVLRRGTGSLAVGAVLGGRGDGLLPRHWLRTSPFLGGHEPFQKGTFPLASRLGDTLPYLSVLQSGRGPRQATERCGSVSSWGSPSAVSNSRMLRAPGRALPCLDAVGSRAGEQQLL